MKVHANVYYAAEALNLPQQVHSDIFTLLAKNQRLDDQAVFASVFAKYGVEEKTYHGTYNSFAVKGKVSQADSRAKKHYQVSGTPEIIVNGKYRVSGRLAGSQVEMLAVTDYLIELERNAQSSPAGWSIYSLAQSELNKKTAPNERFFYSCHIDNRFYTE